MAQVLPSSMRLDNDLGKVEVLGSRAETFVPLRNLTPLEAGTGRMCDGADVNASALQISQAPDEALGLDPHVFFPFVQPHSFWLSVYIGGLIIGTAAPCWRNFVITAAKICTGLHKRHDSGSRAQFVRSVRGITVWDWYGCQVWTVASAK